MDSQLGNGTFFYFTAPKQRILLGYPNFIPCIYGSLQVFP